MENYNEEVLAHYGVKGMRWGVQMCIRDRSQSDAVVQHTEGQSAQIAVVTGKADGRFHAATAW